MKQFLDFLPLAVFFAVYKLYDIFAATKALIVVTAVVLIYSWIRYRKVEKMALITFVLVAVFGGLTIALHDVEFIKWKVTVIYALFAAALLFSQWFMKKPLIQSMLGKELTLPQVVWSRLNTPGQSSLFSAVSLISISPSGCRRISGSTLRSLA
jgi:intracellular septation protein